MENYFAKNLKYLRKRMNITQSEVSVLVSKAHTTIGNWEKRVSEPNIEELIKLVKYFNINIDNIILKDLVNDSGDYQVNKLSVAKEEEEVHESQMAKLVSSQQLNIDTFQKLLAIKEEEIEKLRLENSVLKQRFK